MAVPDFQSFFKPLLELAGDGEEHSVREAREVIAKNMNLSEADLSELLPSGTQTKFDNRVAWDRVNRRRGNRRHTLPPASRT